MSKFNRPYEPVDLKNPPKEHVHYDGVTGKFVGNKSRAVYPDMPTAVNQNNNMEYLNSLERMGAKEFGHPAEKYYENRINENIKKGKSHLSKTSKPQAINYIEKTRENYNDPIIENRGKQTLAFSNAGKKLFKNKIENGSFTPEDVELKLDKNRLHTNKNRTIAVRDSFVAKAFNDALKSPSRAAAPRPFIKKPVIKNKTPAEPVKLDYGGLNNYINIRKDIEKDFNNPQMVAAERRFNQIKKEHDQNQRDRWTKGIASFHMKKY